jgi:hypothetical protein
VTYALGTAAEDLFAAYVYSVVPLQLYQKSTSYLKVSAMFASVCASILGESHQPDSQCVRQTVTQTDSAALHEVHDLWRNYLTELMI